MKPIGACIFVVYFLMIFASLVRFYVFVMPPGGSKMLAVDVSIGPYQWLGRSPTYHEVLTPVQLLLRLQNHHHHTQATTPQTSLAMHQEEKKQVQSIIDQLKGHSLPDGGDIVGSINSSSSEFNATNNRAHIFRQYESGSNASDRKTTGETPDRKGITFSLFSFEDLQQYFVRKLITAVSVCILLAIYIFCSKVSLHLRVRSSTQPSASQQVEIVKRLLLSLSDDFAATIDNSPYEETRKPQYCRIPYGGTREQQYCAYGGTREQQYCGIPYEGTREQQYCGIPYVGTRLTENCLPYEQIRIPPIPAPAPPRAPEKPKEQEKPKPPSAPAPAPPLFPPLSPPSYPYPRPPPDNLPRYFDLKRADAAARLGGEEIVGHIALSSSQFATTNSIAQHVRQDQSGSTSSDSENERTREQENLEEIYTSITEDDLLRRMGRMNRKDAAASLVVSVATFKRKCREFGIKRWPHVRKKKVGRPPNQHGERNTSTACKTPLHNVHARMEGEPVGQNQEANEFRRDFMEHSIALNTENDSIIAVYSETEAARDSSKWAFQLEGQTVQPTTYPYRDDPVFSQSQIASTEVVNENMGSLQDRRDLLASQVVAPQKEPLLEEHVFGFGNWTVGSCSDLALSQTMHTFSHPTGSSENLENLLASMEEHLMEENVYGSSRSDPAPSQPLRTIHYAMAAIPHMMPLPTERQDTGSVKLKATYGDTKIKFQFPLTSGINELKEVMSKILERELGSFKIEYIDENGEWILMALDEHVREYLRLLTSLGNEVTELKVQDKVPNTTNFCDNCRCYNHRSLKRKRP